MTRNKKYSSPAEMQAVIDAYYLRCEEKGKPITVAGLCLALGLVRQSLLNYQNEYDPEYNEIIETAKATVHACVEEMMMGGKCPPVAAIFNLKNNFGWKDQSEQVINGSFDVRKVVINGVKPTGT